MPHRSAYKLSAQAGQAPGSLVYVGEKKTDAPRITVWLYEQNGCQETLVPNPDDLASVVDDSKVTWINIDGLHDTELIANVARQFGLHDLTIEDILNTEHRPKAEDYGEYIYVVLKMLDFIDAEDEVRIEQFSLVIGKNYVLSFQEQTGDVFEPLRERLKNNKGRVKQLGADYLAYSLLDAIIDEYFLILEKIDDRVVQAEEKITAQNPNVLTVIHALRREVMFLRKSIWPVRELVAALQRKDSNLIQDSTVPYFQDLYDHTIQIIDTIDTFREILAGLMDIHLVSLSNRMNAVIKVLTVITTIFMPLTFIAGIYGMNFEHMPELKMRYGYPMVVGSMAIIAIAMLIYFRRKKWL